MKVLYIAAECKPFSKVGGVGDVAGELPLALKKKKVSIAVVAPLYEARPDYLFDELIAPLKKYEFKIPFASGDGEKEETVRVYKRKADDKFTVPIYFIRNQNYFCGDTYGKPYVYSKDIAFYDDIKRFSFFSEACFELIKRLKPDIVHVNDWVMGYLFARMKLENFPAKKILTIHNIGYQGPIGRDEISGWTIDKFASDKTIRDYFEDPRKEWKSVNALRLGLELADKVNTVSPNYCAESLKPEDEKRLFEGGKGLDKIAKRIYEKGNYIGILNGFNYMFAPTESKFKSTLSKKAKMKRALSEDFKNPEAFLLGFVGRAVEQKFRLLAEKVNYAGSKKSVLEHLLYLENVNIAILATGDPVYEDFLKTLGRRPNLSLTIAFNKDKAQQISLGSDIFLMPSLFEPCGITQMESLYNATPPLVRWTGGLVDTVKNYTEDDGNGFGFDGDNEEEIYLNLIETVIKARDYYLNDTAGFRKLQRNGFRKRFLWSDAAKEYINKLYLAD